MKEYINTDEMKVVHYYAIGTYLSAQKNRIDAYLKRDTANIATGYPIYFSSLQNMLNVFNRIDQQVTNYDSQFDYQTDKIYFPNVTPNKYTIYAQYDLAYPADLYVKSSLKIGNTILQPISNEKGIVSYGSSIIDQKVPVTLQMPQEDLADEITDNPEYKPLELQGSDCVVSPIPNIKKTDNFRITFWYKADFSNNVRFVIYTSPEYKKELKKSVILYAENLDKADEQNTKKEFQFAPPMDMNKIFVGVCADSLTKETFQKKIKMQIRNIYSPDLVLLKETGTGNQAATPVTYTFKKINQTKYQSDFSNVSQPFLLGFYEKYNTDWKAYIVKNGDNNFFSTWFKKPIPEDRHIMLDGYMNGWYIDNPGNYSIIVEYRPQKLYYQGLIISVITLLIGVFLLVKRKV